MQQAAAFEANRAAARSGYHAHAFAAPRETDAQMAAAIAAAIDAALLSRRHDYAGQPHAWQLLCEASHVATLCPPLRDAFITRAAEQRGADIALRLAAKADAIRAAAIERYRESALA